MLSSEDLERFYFQYQTEAVPLGMSVQTLKLGLKNEIYIFAAN